LFEGFAFVILVHSGMTEIDKANQIKTGGFYDKFGRRYQVNILCKITYRWVMKQVGEKNNPMVYNPKWGGQSCFNGCKAVSEYYQHNKLSHFQNSVSFGNGFEKPAFWLVFLLNLR